MFGIKAAIKRFIIKTVCEDIAARDSRIVLAKLKAEILSASADGQRRANEKPDLAGNLYRESALTGVAEYGIEFQVSESVLVEKPGPMPSRYRTAVEPPWIDGMS